MDAVKYISVILCLYFFTLAKAEANLKNVKPPSILILRASSEDNKVKSIVLTKGDTLRLECEFPVQPWSYVQWVKLYVFDGFKYLTLSANESFNNGSVKVSSIVLEKAETSDTGNYSCLSTMTSGGAAAFDFVVFVKEQNYCEDNYCAPHGECQELFQGYSCNCNYGYIGKYCDQPDPCIANPCLNNGTCATIDGGFNCTCAYGYAGETCNREVCILSSCNGGGNCSVTNDGNITCNCRYDRAGKRCRHRCTFNSYRTSGYCSRRTCVISASGNERCGCSPDNINHCMMESEVRNECTDPNICNKRGSCRDYHYKYKCNCQSYASGKNCEFFNECSSDQNNVCRRNGANCVDLPDGYKCTNCPLGQSGDKCQYKENPCIVTCGQTSMNVECDLRFLDSKLRSVPIYLNSKVCKFERNEETYYRGYRNSRYMRRTKRIPYASCGTAVQYSDNFIIYSNSLQSGDRNNKENKGDVISRVAGYFLFTMKCKIPRLENFTSAGLTDFSLRVNETSDLHDYRNIVVPTQIQFFKDGWQRISSYVVGDRLYAELSATVSNSILSSRGALIPVTCFATADAAGQGRRYFLLEDECVKDDTFRFEERQHQNGKIKSYFSFESFTFRDNPGKFYLHCDSRVCLSQTELESNNSYNCEIKCQEEISEQHFEQTPEPTSKTFATTQVQSMRAKRSMMSIFGKLGGVKRGQGAITRNSGERVKPLAGLAFA